MQHRSHRFSLRVWGVLAAFVPAFVPAFAAIALATAPTAHAAEIYGAGYTWSALRTTAGASYQCSSWSGGTDGAGNAYIPCYNNIYKLDQAGRLVQVIALPANLPARRDVAPGWDGAVIYYVAGGIIYDTPNPNDPTQAGVGKVVKLVRGADGVYRRDTTFDVGPFALGASWWSARNIAVDITGRVYVTVNAFVYVFDRRGQRLWVFGGDDRYDGVTYLQGLEVAQGIAVTTSGGSVYVVEQRRNHIQRWDYVPTTSEWRRATWRIGFLGQGSDCFEDAGLTSPYDVGLDGAGNLYVLDVTCRRIQKFTASTRTFRGTIWQNYPVDVDQYLYHGFAVDYRGSIVVPEQGRHYHPYTAPPVVCAPDSDAPRFIAIDRPSTAWQRAISLRVRATDSCSSVGRVRVTGNVTSTPEWRTLRTTTSVTLTTGDGAKTLQVSIADAYGRETTRAITVRLDTSQPPLVARSQVSIAGNTRRCQADPMSRIANPGAYQLLDACATFGGRVVAMQRSGATRFVKLLLSLATSQRLYRNARTRVTIWAVGSTATTTGRRLRVGSRARVTSALIADRGLTTVSSVPVYHWTRA